MNSHPIRYESNITSYGCAQVVVTLGDYVWALRIYFIRCFGNVYTTVVLAIVSDFKALPDRRDETTLLIEIVQSVVTSSHFFVALSRALVCGSPTS